MQGQGQSFDYQFLLPNGRRLDVTMIVEVVELDDQTCALTILRDNHREQQYRRKLRRARRKYQTLARFAPVGIFQANAAGELTYINEEFCRLLNGSREQLLGDGWWSAVDPEELPELNRIWTQSIEQRTALHCEFQVLLPGVDEEPERIWLQLQLDPAASGGFVGALTDIDRRKRAEMELQLANRRLEENVRLRTELLIRASKTLEEQIFERRRTYEDLEKSEERWRALMDGAPDVIMLIDRQGSIEYINHTALRPELGVQKVMGRNVLDFVYPEYYDSVKEVVRQVFEEGRSVTNEALGPSDQGTPQWYQSHLAPIYYNGKVIGSTVIVRDITEERRAHAELRQTQERLAHAGRVSTVGELMAGFAHELGQPLFAISSYIEGCLIRLERESESPPDVLQTMREAIDQSHRAIDVVRRLREYLRRQEVQRETYDLNQIVLDAVELASIGVAKNQSRTELRLAEASLPAQVDRIQIMQVLVNLILNAAEAMNGFGSPDPTVTIETRRTDGNAIEILVADAGPGLAEGDSDRIFDAFVTSKHDGLGLGLSISRSIITAHGGTITASNSSTGIGAVFSILLPGNAGE
jgi:PAS domain S-box-containing protein